MDSSRTREPGRSAGHTPSIEDRTAILKAARAKVLANQWDPLDPWRLNESLSELGIHGELQQRKALLEALGEIVERDYRGTFPPEESYEKSCPGAPLLPFAWTSRSLDNRKMYLKFTFWKERLIVITFHPQRPR